MFWYCLVIYVVDCHNHIVLVFFIGYVAHRKLHVLTHSFPTRRSSDLPHCRRTLRWSRSTVAGDSIPRSSLPCAWNTGAGLVVTWPSLSAARKGMPPTSSRVPTSSGRWGR